MSITILTLLIIKWMQTMNNHSHLPNSLAKLRKYLQSQIQRGLQLWLEGFKVEQTLESIHSTTEVCKRKTSKTWFSKTLVIKHLIQFWIQIIQKYTNCNSRCANQVTTVNLISRPKDIPKIVRVIRVLNHNTVCNNNSKWWITMDSNLKSQEVNYHLKIQILNSRISNRNLQKETFISLTTKVTYKLFEIIKD
jgi:hypothetical protein